MIDSLLHGMGQLLAYFYSLVPNYGVSIIMLTILVRTAMIPLAIKQAHSMQANRGNAEKMRKLQPEVKKLKEKYKDDRQRQYEEQKKLYEEHGVNMLGGLNGCLPMLLQMPIFLAMYAVLSGCSKLFMGRNCTPGYHIPKESPLYTAIVERSGTFLGTNLEFKPAEVFSNLGPVAVLPYAILIAVMGGTMYYQTNMMMKAQPAPDPQMAATQKIMKFMPLMLVFFSWQFPAGLILYWSATNVWTIGQQYVLMKKYGGTPVVPDGKPAKSPSGNAATAAVGDSGTKGSSPTKNAKSAVKAKPAGRRPAAKQARPGGKSSSSTSAKAGSNGQKAKGSATPSDGNGSGKAPGAKGPAARPKGSGARKGNKGGRR
jgi:YidC/Oxa1 family membrane protein insertase